MESWGKNSSGLMNSPTQNDEIVIDVKGLIYVLCKKWWIMLIVGILGASIVHFTINQNFTITYSMGMTMSVTPKPTPEKAVTVTDVTVAYKLVPTYVELIWNSQILSEIATVSKTGLNGGTVSGMLGTYFTKDTNIFDLTVHGESEEIVQAVMDAAIQVVPKSLMEIVPIGIINVVDTSKLANDAYTHNPLKNMIIGGGLGAVLAAFIICVVELIKNPIRTEKKLESSFDMVSLGSVPKFKVSKRNLKKLKEKRSAHVTSSETDQNISM